MPTIAFNQPFAEQAEFFRKKLNLPTQAYDDIIGSAHDHAFVVAGAMQADLLADLRKAVDKAIIEGKGLTAFRKEFKDIVARTGWAHTGPANWRSRVIFTTNLRTSHAAGRWAQLTKPSSVKARPFWRYVHSDYVLDPRPLHQAWHGIILPWDDPWWITHFGPNGLGCQCTVQAIAADELASYGKTQADNPPSDAWDTRGIDEGWDYAPGQAATEAARIADVKAKSILKKDEPMAIALVSRLIEKDGFEEWKKKINDQISTANVPTDLNREQRVSFLQKVVPDQGSWPAAVLRHQMAQFLGLDAAIVQVSTQTLIKQIEFHPDVLHEDYKLLQSIFDDPEIVFGQQKDTLQSVYFKKDQRLYKAVIKVTGKKDAVLLMTFFQAKPKQLQKMIDDKVEIVYERKK